MNKKISWILVVAAILALGVAGYLYFFRQAKEGTVTTARTVSEGVPEINTNAVGKVPEVNPLDRANPFKYTNPLR